MIRQRMTWLTAGLAVAGLATWACAGGSASDGAAADGTVAVEEAVAAAAETAGEAIGAATASWELDMAGRLRPGLPGEKTLAAWREARGWEARTAEVARTEGAVLAKEALAAAGAAFPEDAVWRTAYESEFERVEVAEFRDGDGRLNRVAVYEQIGNPIPYYWTVEGGDAAQVAATAPDVWAVEGVLERGDTDITEMGKPVEAPYERFRFRFLDDAPGKDWMRPCRYLFENADGSGFTVLWKRLPPRLVSRTTGRDVSWAGAVPDAADNP